MNRAVMAAWFLLAALSGLRADITVWELPPDGGAGAGDRRGWRPAEKGSRFDGGLAAGNERLTVVAAVGAPGPVIRSAPEGFIARILVRASDGTAAKIRRAWLKDGDPTEIAIGLAAGGAEVELALGAAAAFVRVRPVTNAGGIAAECAARYALVPSFAGEDQLYDASAVRSAVVPAQARQALLLPGAGGNGILALMWSDEDGAAMERGKTAKPGADARTVGLTPVGEGDARVFASAAVGFNGRPVCVGMLSGSNIWHAADARKLPGRESVTLAWQRPFDAAWKVDMHVADYDGKQVAAFLERAAQLGLSAGRENEWRNFYLTLGGQRKDADPLRVEAGYFKYVGAGAGLPPAVEGMPEEDTRAWPFVFRGRESVVTVPADWPCYPDPTKERIEEARARLAKTTGELPRLIHVYGVLITYPLDRTDRTPPDRLAVVDLMRQALGIGPCKLDWLDSCR